MARNVIGIIFYVIAGFFFYGVGLLAFINMPDVGKFNFVIMGIFAIPALVCTVIGAVVHSSGNWKASAGIVLLSAAAFNLFVVMTLISLMMSPELEKLVPNNSLSMFTGYRSGFATMAVQVCTGGLLLIAGWKQRAGNKAGRPG
jgi:hypothetical protein